MIIPEKLIDAASIVLSEETQERVELTITCGVEGYYCGKIMRSDVLWKRTKKVTTFKRALNDLLQLCYNEIGDENG